MRKVILALLLALSLIVGSTTGAFAGSHWQTPPAPAPNGTQWA